MAIDVFDSLGDALLPVLGEPATLTQKGQPARAVTILIDRNPREVADASGGQRMTYPRTFKIKQTDYTSPNEGGDLIAFKRNAADASDTTFVIQRLLGQTGGMWWLGVKG